MSDPRRRPAVGGDGGVVHVTGADTRRHRDRASRSSPSWSRLRSPTRRPGPSCTASRARIVATGDEARRHLERDLHDGVQQRLVSLALELRVAEKLAPPEGHDELVQQLSHIGEGMIAAVDELREVSHGIHPAILSEGGLRPALSTVARRSPVPVELEIRDVDRLPEPVEVGVYYVVSEALTNVIKHAQASFVQVDLEADEAVGPASGAGRRGRRSRRRPRIGPDRAEGPRPCPRRADRDRESRPGRARRSVVSVPLHLVPGDGWAASGTHVIRSPAAARTPTVHVELVLDVDRWGVASVWPPGVLLLLQDDDVDLSVPPTSARCRCPRSTR